MEPKLPERCNTVLNLQGTNNTSDPTLNSLGNTILQITGEATQADCPNTRRDELNKPTGPIINDPANDTQSTTYKPYKSNAQKYGEFRGRWGAYAVTSGLISPVFFNTYQAILNLPLPANNISKAKFEEDINLLAYMIKLWYFNARYAGDLAKLEIEIERSKPEWSPPPFLASSASASASASASESFLNYAPYKNTRIKESVVFASIVGVGLVAYCFWKACK